MMKKRLAGLVLASLMGLAVPSVLAAVGPSDAEAYTLDPVLVTATRSEKSDVDVPMSTNVISGEELTKQGANNLHTALGMVTGVNYKQFGPGGAAMGTMMNEVSIRGIKNGTLVMVNGSPINLRGKYYLDAIPPERIERVEVIKGGGSVLYGSEAMAGVINIITKDEGMGSIAAGYGNMGQRRLDLEVGDKNFSVGTHYEKWGYVDHVNILDNYRYANAAYAKKESHHVGTKITDHLRFSYDNFKTKTGYENYFYKALGKAKVGDLQQTRLYETNQHLFELNYDKDDFQAKAYYNRLDIAYSGPNYFDAKKGNKLTGAKAFTDEKERNRSYGLDVQNTWHLSDKSTFIAGTTYQNEFYDAKVKSDKDVKRERHNYAVYGQFEHKLNNRDTVILAGRETWTTGQPNNYKNFSGSGQFIHALNEDENIYVNVSQSFIMPTFAQMYGASESAIPNPGLKPQKGINYELGYKKIHDRHSYKIALYHMTITDNIKVSANNPNGTLIDYKYINSEFKNTGLEAEMAYKGDHGWSYHVGINIQDPKSKDSGDDAKKPYWDREFGRLQISGGLTYEHGPWTTSFTASYLGERVGSPSGSHSFDIGPYFLTTWNTTYSFNEASSLSLRVDNVLDRDDILSNTGSTYTYTPINYLLTYNQKF